MSFCAEVIAIRITPKVTSCRTMLDSLHIICLTNGLEFRRPKNIIASLVNVLEYIIFINLCLRWKKPKRQLSIGDKYLNSNRITTNKTHKLLIPLKIHLTALVFDGILYLVVVLRKLVMPVAGGVPCVGSTFFIPQHRKKGYICQKHF